MGGRALPWRKERDDEPGFPVTTGKGRGSGGDEPRPEAFSVDAAFSFPTPATSNTTPGNAPASGSDGQRYTRQSKRLPWVFNAVIN